MDHQDEEYRKRNEEKVEKSSAYVQGMLGTFTCNALFNLCNHLNRKLLFQL